MWLGTYSRPVRCVGTSESAELSGSFLAFMVLATLIAGVGILTDSVILIIGAMVDAAALAPPTGAPTSSPTIGHALHLQPRSVLRHRRRARRNRRRPLALHREVRCADRRPDLRDDDPRRGERRGSRRLSRLDEVGGAASQLGINLIAIVPAGVSTLGVQRTFYVRRRRAARPAR